MGDTSNVLIGTCCCFIYDMAIFTKKYFSSPNKRTKFSSGPPGYGHRRTSLPIKPKKAFTEIPVSIDLLTEKLETNQNVEVVTVAELMYTMLAYSVKGFQPMLFKKKKGQLN